MGAAGWGGVITGAVGCWRDGMPAAVEAGGGVWCNGDCVTGGQGSWDPSMFKGLGRAAPGTCPYQREQSMLKLPPPFENAATDLKN